jgi:hypothetical protein
MRQPGRRSRLAAARPLAIVVGLIVVLAAALGGRAHSSAFAGYVWGGRVSSVQGSWTVPRILRGSPPGVAATWIGAQGPGGGSAPFIQLGSDEQLLASSITGSHLAGPRAPAYFAFWSDTARHFHPLFLFPVSPGDELSASMTLGPRGWALSIKDETSGASASLTTTYALGARYNEVEWTQEDVTDGRTSKPFPYPRLSTVVFTHLTVNSHAPGAGAVYSQPMSEPGVSLTPSTLSDDAFALPGS